MGDPAPGRRQKSPGSGRSITSSRRGKSRTSGAQPMAVQAVSVANYHVPQPENFGFKPEDWTNWIRRLVIGWSRSKNGENQVNTLVYSMGKEADDIMISFGLTTDESMQYVIVRNRFESRFIAKRNIIFERTKFNFRSQQESESVEPLRLICTFLPSTVNLAYLSTNLSEIG